MWLFYQTLPTLVGFQTPPAHTSMSSFSPSSPQLPWWTCHLFPASTMVTKLNLTRFNFSICQFYTFLNNNMCVYVYMRTHIYIIDAYVKIYIISNQQSFAIYCCQCLYCLLILSCLFSVVSQSRNLKRG